MKYWLDYEAHAFWDSRDKWVHRMRSRESTKELAKESLKRMRKKYGRGIFVMQRTPDGDYGIYMKKYIANKRELEDRFTLNSVRRKMPKSISYV